VPKTLTIVTPGGLPDCPQPFLATTHSTTIHGVSYAAAGARHKTGSSRGLLILFLFLNVVSTLVARPGGPKLWRRG